MLVQLIGIEEKVLHQSRFEMEGHQRDSIDIHDIHVLTINLDWFNTCFVQKPIDWAKFVLGSSEKRKLVIIQIDSELMSTR